MKRFNLLLCCVAVSTVGALPAQERDIFDPLGSLISSAFGITDTATAASSGTTLLADPLSNSAQTTSATATTKSSHKSAKTRSATSSLPTSTSSDSSSASASASASSTSTSSSSTITSIPTHSSITPAATAPAQTTPSAQSSNSGGITPAGIAVAAVMGVVVIGVIAFLIFKFCGPVRRWREQRSEERRAARTYRPALDGPLPASTGHEKGLGLSQVEQQPRRPFSFMSMTSLTPATQPIRPPQPIKRKPVPQPAAARWADSDEEDNGTARLIGLPPSLRTGRSEKGLPRTPPFQR